MFSLDIQKKLDNFYKDMKFQSYVEFEIKKDYIHGFSVILKTDYLTSTYIRELFYFHEKENIPFGIFSEDGKITIIY